MPSLACQFSSAYQIVLLAFEVYSFGAAGAALVGSFPNRRIIPPEG
jgi:hypothetical protein